MERSRADRAHYYDGLSSLDKEIYKSQLVLPDGSHFPDPFEIKEGWEKNPKNWPQISYYDIINYFVFKTSLFSFEETKAYKSLEAYNYALEGHVQDIQSVLFNDYTALMAEVLPSQRQGHKSVMYKAFLLVDKDGKLHTAHCTCMAGNGKACSHAAAIAFKIDFVLRTGLVDKAPTEELCKWNVAAKKEVEPARLREMNFSKLQRKGSEASSRTITRPQKRLCFSAFEKVSLKKVVQHFPQTVVATTIMMGRPKSVQHSTPLPDNNINSLAIDGPEIT